METHSLDLVTIARGVAIMSEKFPSHFREMMSENFDAETGDCMLQCCLFGDIVYG